MVWDYTNPVVKGADQSDCKKSLYCPWSVYNTVVWIIQYIDTTAAAADSVVHLDTSKIFEHFLTLKMFGFWDFNF